MTDTIFELLQELKNLTVLKLDHTQINGDHIGKLSRLEHLKAINLVMTSLSKQPLEALFTFPNLEKV